MQRPAHPAAFTPLALQGTQSLWNTFYWIEEALQHHIREFQAQPDVLSLLAGRPGTPAFDLIARLEQLRQSAQALSRDIRHAKSGLPRLVPDEPPFADLPAEQAAELARINTRLDQVGQHIETVTQGIRTALAGPLAAPADRLCDNNLDVNVSFHMHDGDPACGDDSDNLVAQLNGFSRSAEQWPDGYDASFPMPHGGLMYELRLYGGNCMERVAYRDIQRIGWVWVDVVVTYQYLYDLKAGRWVKDWRTPDGGQDGGRPTWVE